MNFILKKESDNNFCILPECEFIGEESIPISNSAINRIENHILPDCSINLKLKDSFSFEDFEEININNFYDVFVLTKNTITLDDLYLCVSEKLITEEVFNIIKKRMFRQ